MHVVEDCVESVGNVEIARFTILRISIDQLDHQRCERADRSICRCDTSQRETVLNDVLQILSCEWLQNVALLPVDRGKSLYQSTGMVG